MGALRPYTREWVEELCAESFSLAEVVRKSGRRGGGSQQILKKKIEEWDIDTSHFTGQGWNKGFRFTNCHALTDTYRGRNIPRLHPKDNV